jgi:cation transport regulator ChaB
MKGATCHFCGQRFRNRQAVRAHLKGCAAYRQLPEANLPKDIQPTAPAGGTSAAGTRSTAGRATRRARVRSRIDDLWADPGDLGNGQEEILRRPHARGEPDQRTRQQEAARQREDDRELARLRTQQEAEERARREVAGREARERRRRTIQNVKDQTVGWYSGGCKIPREAEAQALTKIEQELWRLPEDLPESELAILAEGIRDRIYQPVIQAQDQARKDEERKRQQARRREDLVEAGVAYASRELEQEKDLEAWLRWNIPQKVQQLLEREIVGNESESDVEDRVDEILDRELEAADEKRSEQARPKLIAHGRAYAKRELGRECGLDLWQRSRIAGIVGRELEHELTGQEAEDDVEVLVDAILDQELGEAEEAEDDEEAVDDVDDADDEADEADEGDEYDEGDVDNEDDEDEDHNGDEEYRDDESPANGA